MILNLVPQPVKWLLESLIRLFISDIRPNSTVTNVNSNDVNLQISNPVNTINTTPPSPASSIRRRIFQLIISFIGLQTSYLLWGLLQERIMTRTYDGRNFNNSQFLVFMNRLLSMFVSYACFKIFCQQKSLIENTNIPLGTPVSSPRIYDYCMISYANCMSTWFQYESLLYISFPVQVVAKSIKTIPVMLIGRFVSNKTYPLRQYLFMFLMGCGLALFFFGYNENSSIEEKINKNSTSEHNRITTISGLILLSLYLGFDGYTSNYQKYVFDKFQITFLHMMFYVNLISTVLTLTSLILNGTFFQCFYFMRTHQLFFYHVSGMSLCSAIGQLFIFSTIEEFGPVIFTIIMTMRQAFSIVLSCLFYGHTLTLLAIFGLHIAFAALFLHAYFEFKKFCQLQRSNIQVT
ncbi:unnamed protein product [Didymodactylos carnosus]|uniref:Adenosine 3'-phospho 5'-phosphosulfate transporter 1 n=1 Tax=Didymodactylos carnosus TaxID=1234261 RepID=A0A814N0I2_9BILA|nr:unnamed protein product [Didymodactylos carnosus]CAF1086570.1 unnamed protein product [Didymodactylos carnosus]CAF3766683.1 unnamed protein product [Didymodactylos carnosus]CAF3852092.1 unnamed protein product [Didymodactylos carnosus]